MPRKAKSNKEPDWKDSAAKALLEEDVRNGTIDANMSAKDAFFYRPEYSETDYSKWASRFSSVKKQVTHHKDRAVIDSVAFANTELMFPTNKTYTSRGELRWDGSSAQSKLVIDFDNNKHLMFTPMELYYSRAEYQMFSLTMFRKHIAQEVKRRKFIETYKARKKPSK